MKTIEAGMKVGVTVRVRTYEGEIITGVISAVEYEDVTVVCGGIARSWPMYRVELA